jgi:hypothetical protein
MREQWAVAHVRLTCDKCGDAQQDTQGGRQEIVWDGWREVKIGKEPSACDALGSTRSYLLCPGCAGMLEHFLGLKAGA